jgi:hypothetical protein
MNLYEVIFWGADGYDNDEDTIYLVRAADWRAAVEHVRINASPSVHKIHHSTLALHLWRPGALSKVRDVLSFDEWSYFIGFQACQADAIARASRLGLSDYFSPAFYDLLTREGHLFVVQIDGWWEFCPATDALLSRIMECAPCREIAPRGSGDVDWTPQFV